MQNNQLSSKQYVRTKARTLPIYKCFINADWEESGLASIVVMRKHKTGTITFGLFLADLRALGVKDSGFHFNIPEPIAMERLAGGGMVETEYSLVHNIIYGANKFALKHGFRIYKEFISTDQYILEPESADIPFIDIEFGLEGKPFVMITPAYPFLN